MARRARILVVTVLMLWPFIRAGAAEPGRKLTSMELAQWIDGRFAEEYRTAGVEPVETVDDATFLRRIFLDLQGRIPTVAQLRDFLASDGTFKREDLIDRLVRDDDRPDLFAQRSSQHLARVWRRMMVPASAPGAPMAVQLDPWLATQFAANTPYDQLARKLLLASPQQTTFGLASTTAMPADPDAAAGIFQMAVGPTPENLASAYARVFLGVRLNCAQCHDHPFTDWTQNDFWGIAAFFAQGAGRQDQTQPAPVIRPPDNQAVSYTAKLLWAEQPLKEIPAEKSPRDLLAEWMVSPDNPNFAATAVNRTWQYLCGRGLTGSVDDLDQVSPEERRVLDDLAKLFIDSGYDVQWLVTGICKSKVYQQALRPGEKTDGEGFVHRPLKSLLPEQVFDSLEQALSLPVARADNGPRFNGERDQFVQRMNESTAESPADYKGGIPQALMMMNGRMSADATSLETSRTLRAVVEAPFLKPEEKLETLFMAVLSRKPKPAELEYLLVHLKQKSTEDQQKEAFAEIMWGLLNSPEFVLSR